MSEQTTFDWESSELEENENKFLKFPKDGTVRVKHLGNDPVVSNNRYGNLQYNFEVLDMDSKTVVTHSITSKQYMRELRELQPLEGKELCVQRKGTGFDTHYIVSLV